MVIDGSRAQVHDIQFPLLALLLLVWRFLGHLNYLNVNLQSTIVVAFGFVSEVQAKNLPERPTMHVDDGF